MEKQEKQLYTGHSTQVLSPREYNKLAIDVTLREVPKLYLRDHMHFSVEKKIEFIEIERMLSMLEERVEGNKQKSIDTKPKKLSRKEEVNQKRAQVAMYYFSGQNYTIKRVASLTGCHRDTVKSVFQELQLRNQLIPYEYNNQHYEEDLQELERVIEDPKNLFYSVSQIKRLQPRFSKRRIARELKKSGYKWKKLKRVPAKLNVRRSVPDPSEIHRVISAVVTGLFDEDKEVYFVDEFKLPLNQTPDYSWSRGPGQDYMYNNRPEALQYTGIVMCSVRGFEFYQIYLDEVNSRDFLHFMQEAIQRLPNDKEITVLMDCATWHKAEILKSSDVYRFFCFNVPGVFQLNIIETAFSAIRNDFRQRAVCNNTTEELQAICELFSEEANGRRFRGYYVNYLRTLRQYLREEDF